MVTPLHTARSQVNGLTKKNDRAVRGIWLEAVMLVEPDYPCAGAEQDISLVV
jgi:hypothetical protein